MKPFRSFRSIAVLLVLLIAAAAAAYWWQGPRRLAGGRPIEIRSGEIHLTATFSPDPPRTGENRLELRVGDAGGDPVDAAEVHATATMPAMGTMAEMRAPAEVEALGEGLYRLSIDLPMAGSWPLSLHVHAPGRSEARAEFEYKTGIPVRLASAPHAGADAGGDDAVAHYTCSMHPSVRSSTPGKCPICGMDLVPVTEREVDTGMIRVDAARRQMIGVQTGRVERKPVTITIRGVGTVAYDETRLTDVTLKVRGWIGEVFAGTTGIRVEKGKPLFTIYAPELLSAQEELLQALRRSPTGGRVSPLVATARRRLRLWNLTPEQIDAVARSGEARETFPILSPASGAVIEKNVVGGSTAEAGARLYRIADLSTVWIDAEVYESDVPLVAAGQAAEVTLPYVPGRRFTAEISQVYPYLDPSTRTARVRLVVPNEDGTLAPDMYGAVEIRVPLGERLVVPEDAVLIAGTRSLVFVDLGEGRLQPRTVELGRKARDEYVVQGGLEEGDVVVTSGTFLIAAESKLKSGARRW